MPDTQVVLGGFTFQDFEVPESIPFGGEQALGVHKLIGGAKVVDAMGWFPRDIGWSGRFRGPDALSRARSVQALFKAGQAMTLTWGNLSFRVVGQGFTPNYERFYEIPYVLSLEVVEDLVGPITVLTKPSLDDQLNTDLPDVQVQAADIGDAEFSSDVSAVSDAMGQVPSFVTASTSTISSVVGLIATAQGRAGVLVASADATLKSVSSFGGVVPGGDPLTMAAGLTAQASAMATLDRVGTASNLLARMAVNLQASGASGATVIVAGGTLYDLAAKHYGDPTEWTTIAEANGLLDPVLTGLNTIRIPARGTGAQGVWPT